jgi:hypothetical protein
MILILAIIFIQFDICLFIYFIINSEIIKVFLFCIKYVYYNYSLTLIELSSIYNINYYTLIFIFFSTKLHQNYFYYFA